MSQSIKTPITDMLIRDLVEQYPDTMRVLAPLGIDLCCGGGHPLGEALDLHGIDRTTVLSEIEAIVAAPSPSA
jgi:regulator of cell morphogenesis and NO signaling